MLEKVLEKVRAADKKVREKWKLFEDEHPILCTAGLFTILGATGYWCLKSLLKKPNLNEIMLTSAYDIFGDGNFYFIDSEGKVHESIGGGCFAIWPDIDSYQESHKELLGS